MAQRSIRRGGVERGKELGVCMRRKSVIQLHVEMLSLYCWVKSVCCARDICITGSNESCFKCKECWIAVSAPFCLAWAAWPLTDSQQRPEGSLRCVPKQQHKRPHSDCSIARSSGVEVIVLQCEELEFISYLPHSLPEELLSKATVWCYLKTLKFEQV